MAATGLHISISAETIFHVGPLAVSNSILISFIVTVLLLSFGFAVRSQLRTSGRPSGIQNFAEFIIEALMGLVESVTGSARKTRIFLPLIVSFFLVILLNNWLGLVPGVGTIGFYETAGEEKEISFSTAPLTVPVEQVHASTELEVVEEPTHETATEVDAAEASLEPHEAETTESHEEAAHRVFVPFFRAGTADLNTTIALAIVSVFMTQVFGFQFLKFSYFKKYINFSSPINFFVGLLETVLEFAKIMSFAFRLFGNIFAGEVLLTVITFLVPVIVPMPFYGLEIVVGVIQALVFSMLSVVFFNMATLSHDEH